MGDGKGSHDADDFPYGDGEVRHGLPLSALPDQHRGHQQRYQEQQMVEPKPNMPDAFSQIQANLLPNRAFSHRERVNWGLLTENRRLGVRLIGQAKQPLVLGIEIEQQSIVNGQVVNLRWTGRGELYDRVGAV